LETKTTNGVTVVVETACQEEQSMPDNRFFLFAYQITIRNANEFPIQILKRHWIITDTLLNLREVKGDGVVGVQPIILKNEQYQYVSSCHFETEVGKMRGFYIVKNVFEKSLFTIEIPSFTMIVPSLLN
jgi:ApaG protein